MAISGGDGGRVVGSKLSGFGSSVRDDISKYIIVPSSVNVA